jgi:hypothetical protein
MENQQFLGRDLTISLGIRYNNALNEQASANCLLKTFNEVASSRRVLSHKL